MNKFFYKKKINISAVAFVILCCLLFIFKNQAISFYWKIKCPTPVVWKNVRVPLDVDMIYKQDDNKIVFVYWKGIPKGSLSVSSFYIDKHTMIIDALIKQDHIILESYYDKIDNQLSFIIKHRNRTNQSNHNTIYIIERQLLIHYEGPQENFKDFERTINNIKFMQQS